MLKSVRKQKLIKYFCLFSALVLIFSQANQFPHEASSRVQSGEKTLANIQYVSTLTGENSNSDVAAQENIPLAKASEFVCKDATELSDTVRKNMIPRITDFSITYKGVSPENVLSLDTFSKFLSTVFSYDDSSASSDFDYLRLSWTKAQLTVTNTNGFKIHIFVCLPYNISRREIYRPRCQEDCRISRHRRL